MDDRIEWRLGFLPDDEVAAADARRGDRRPAVSADRRVGRARDRDRPRPPGGRHRRRLARRDRARLRRSARSCRPATSARSPTRASGCSSRSGSAAAFEGTRAARKALTWDAGRARARARVRSDPVSFARLERRCAGVARALVSRGPSARSMRTPATSRSRRTTRRTRSAPRGARTKARVLYPFLLRDLRGEPFGVDAADIVTPYGYGGAFFWGATATRSPRVLARVRRVGGRATRRLRVRAPRAVRRRAAAVSGRARAAARERRARSRRQARTSSGWTSSTRCART